jgi:hypothetical protein
MRVVCFTASLKRVHEVKIWFSVLANSSCNFKKFSLAFNSGYCSTVTNKRDKNCLRHFEQGFG